MSLSIFVKRNYLVNILLSTSKVVDNLCMKPTDFINSIISVYSNVIRAVFNLHVRTRTLKLKILQYLL